jgi:hypothetical protein
MTDTMQFSADSNFEAIGASAFTFQAKGKVIVTIDYDGKVTLGENLTLDEASKAFYEIIIELFKQNPPSTKISQT